MVGSQPLYDMLRRFAATMVHSFDIDDVLHEFGDHAVAILDAAGAGVSVAVAGRLGFVTATSTKVIDIEHAQEAHQAGPCVEAYQTGDVVAITSIAALDRWPDYRAAAKAAGFVSVVGIPLAIDNHRVGSLNVYDTRERNWSDTDLDAARVLADIATAYIVRSGELAQSRELSAQLQHALDSRVIIEQAKGMLARDHDTNVDEAFELLRRHSRNQNLPLREVARRVVELGIQLPPP